MRKAKFMLSLRRDKVETLRKLLDADDITDALVSASASDTQVG